MALKYGTSRDLRRYYSISEVCSLVGIEASTIRHWETRFPELSPKRHKSGSRNYKIKDIQILQLIRHFLYVENYNDEMVRLKIKELNQENFEKEFMKTLNAPKLYKVEDNHSIKNFMKYKVFGELKSSLDILKRKLP